LLILAVLMEGSRHGYAIAQEIRTISQGHVTIRPGDLYRVLYRMDQAGLIEPAPTSARSDDTDARRVDYRITPLGRRVARAQARLVTEALAVILRPATRPGATS
jgi:DNA-binding PadR family transcriptional regulator